MKLANLLFTALAVVVWSGCETFSLFDGQKADVELNFQGYVGNERLVLSQFYPYQTGQAIAFQTVKLYISAIKLLKGNEATDVADIIEVNFYQHHTDAAGAAAGEAFTFTDLPAGEYTGIQLGIGVSPTLNMTNPSDYAVGHPLANSGNFWSWRETYIFGQYEGILDTTGNSAINDIFFTFHPGDNERYRTITLDKDFTLLKKENNQLVLRLDLRQLFTQTDGTMHNIVQYNQSHTAPEDAWIVDGIMDRMQAAFSVE